ncbi:MAG: CopG family transcriptional regulator [Opitutales bacterium]|nr:CopG family transcriptional regulator [Opitutales bacterium]
MNDLLPQYGCKMGMKSVGRQAYKCDAFDACQEGGIPPSSGTPPKPATQAKIKRRKPDEARKTYALPSIRVTKDELEKISEIARNANQTKTEFIRKAILIHIKKAGQTYNDYRQRIYTTDPKLINELNCIGKNINQLAKGLNSDKLHGNPIILEELFQRFIVASCNLSKLSRVIDEKREGCNDR